MLRLKDLYQKEIIPKMKEKFGFKNDLRVPRFVKAIVHVGVGRSKEDPKLFGIVENTLKTITGQKPSVRVARKAISGFKIKKGDKIGLMVTLRNQRMYDFIEKLIRIVLPRIRDFRGLEAKAIDKQSNLNIGIKEQVVFPEIKPDQIEKMHGLQVTLVTTAERQEEAKELFKLAGFIFKES